MHVERSRNTAAYFDGAIDCRADCKKTPLKDIKLSEGKFISSIHVSPYSPHAHIHTESFFLHEKQITIAVGD